MKLRLGKLSLPLETVTQSIAILARKRAGKSYLARGLAEQLLAAEQQVVIVDPKGDWWGIRSSADGKAPGFPVVVLGGEHGDLPLERTAADTVARLIVEERVSVLLDLSEFRKHEVAKFLGGDVRDRADGLLEIIYRLKAKEEFRSPVMLIVDEADAIAPQKPNPGEERMLGAMSDIVRRGGQRGIGCTLITQRSAVINKDVLTQTQVMVALRTIAPLDLAAIMGWVDVHGDIEQAKVLKASLPALPIGDAWILSPGWPTETGIFERIHGNAITTFDSGATPKPGEKRIRPKNLADVDLAALQRRMAETIERKKADDPAELRRQIAELRKQLAAPAKAVPSAAPNPDALKKAREVGAEDVRKELAGELLKFKSAIDKRLAVIAGSMRAAMMGLDGLPEFPAIDAIIARSPAIQTQRPRPHATQPARPAPPPRPRPNGAAVEANGEKLSPAAQKILDALAELQVLGVREAPRVQVAFMAGYTNLNSKGFTNAIGALRSAGYIDYPGAGSIALTNGGERQASAVDAPRSSAELQDRLISMLGGANGRIVRELVKEYPGSIERGDLAARAGYGNTNSKGFTNAIGRLRTLGFIDYPSTGQVAARPVLFLEGS